MRQRLVIMLLVLGLAASAQAQTTPAGLIDPSKITCVGTFRIAVPQGSVADFSRGMTAMTYRYVPGDTRRHYYVLAGSGHVLESVEPTTLAACSASVNTTPFTQAAAWGWGGPDGSATGSDWGAFPIASTSGCATGNYTDFLPGDCWAVKPGGLKWDDANGLLVETWFPIYNGFDTWGKNGLGAATLNSTTHTLALTGCWAANPATYQQITGGGLLIPPASWVTANQARLPASAKGYWLLGLGGATGTVEITSNGPSLQLVPVPSGNACTNGTTTPFLTPAGTVLARFAANALGPTCGGGLLGCSTSANPPTHPFPAKLAYTGYSQTFSPYWWDPYGGHGWFWGSGTSWGMDWYDDGVVRGVVVPYRIVSGWATGTIAATPAPSYNAATGAGSFSTTSAVDTHDGAVPHVDDVMWAQTCAPTVPGCDAANARDWTWLTITGVSTPTPGTTTYTYAVGGLDFSTGNHVPVPGMRWWFGPFYGHGATGGFFPRATFRLQIIDPNEYTKVLNGTYATPDLPTYYADVDASALMPAFGSPATGRGVAQNGGGGNSYTGPSWSGADPAHQQFLTTVSFTDCTGGPNYSTCGQVYVWKIGHSTSTTMPAPRPATVPPVVTQ